MNFYPAIDLKNGQCVRLEKGRMDTAKVYNDSPADQARLFAEAGCTWIHVVDLDGAFAGRPVNAPVVRDIVETTGISVQLGGGIRSMDTISAWLEAGVQRVILGTAAVQDPELVFKACARFPGRIAVGIDARDGQVAVEGWAKASTLSVAELAGRFETAGVAAIIHTDIARDGVLTGPNVEASADLAARTSIPVIVSGGISGPEDLEACRAAGDLEGVIAGRALYEGRLNPADAVRILREVR